MNDFAAGIMTLDQVQAEHVRNVLEALDGNITAAAHALDVDRRTLYRMCERWKIDVSEYRETAVKPLSSGYDTSEYDEGQGP